MSNREAVCSFHPWISGFPQRLLLRMPTLAAKVPHFRTAELHVKEQDQMDINGTSVMKKGSQNTIHLMLMMIHMKPKQRLSSKILQHNLSPHHALRSQLGSTSKAKFWLAQNDHFSYSHKIHLPCTKAASTLLPVCSNG